MSYDEFENLIRSIFGGMYTNAARWFEDFSRISGDEFQNSATQIALQSLQDAKMGTLRLLQNDVLNQIESGSQFISMPPLVEELRNDPAQAEIYGSVIDYFDRLFNGDQAVERDDILTNDEFFVIGAGLASNTSTSPSGDFGWSVTNQGQIDRYSTLRDTYQTERQDYLERAEVYGDALFDQLQLQEGLRDDFDNWWEGYIEGGVSRMPQAIFDAVYDNQGPTIQQAIGTLGSIQDFDITNMPASGGASNQVDQVLTEGTDLRDEPVNTDSNTTSDQDITNLPAGGTDDTTTGTTMEEFSLIRIGNIVYRAYPVPGSNAPRLEPAQPGDVDIGGGTYDNPNSVYENWDDFIYGGVLDVDQRPGDGSQSQSSDDGGLLDQAINFIQTLLGGGGGSMSQDQAQVLQNVLQDLIDFEVGDITATTGDQTTEVDVTTGDQTQTQATDVDASSDVDVTTGDVSAEGGMSDVDVTTGDVTAEGGAGGTATATGGEGGSVGDVLTDVITEVIFGDTAGGSVGDVAASVGDVTGGSVGDVTGGSVGDVSGGSAVIESGAAQGGQGGQGGEGGSVGDVSVTTDFGNMFEDIGNFFGDAFESAFDFVGDIFGGQNATQLATILADQAARNYAADKYGEAAAAELDFQQDIYGNTLNLFRPFYEAGTEGAVFDDETGQLIETGTLLPEFVDMAKTGVDYTGLGLDPFDEEDPGLRFLQDEARRAIENSAAAKGRLNTGGTLTDLQDRAAGIASVRAGEIANINSMLGEEARRRDQYDLGKLGGLTQGAFNAAGAMSGANQNFASAYGNILGQQGAYDADKARRDSEYYRNIFSDLFGV